jgi:hypothetical protein
MNFLPSYKVREGLNMVGVFIEGTTLVRKGTLLVGKKPNEAKIQVWMLDSELGGGCENTLHCF